MSEYIKLDAVELAFVLADRKLDAIRTLNLRTGCGLIEAKRLVEAAMPEDGHIHVELDFIPVEEGPPKAATNICTSQRCFIIAFSGKGASTLTTGHYDHREKYIGWHWTSGGTVRGDGWHVTHYAEIPEIKT